MPRGDDHSQKQVSGLDRREILGGIAGLAAAAGFPSPGLAQGGPAATAKDYPVVDVAPLAKIEVGSEISFQYPDADSPAILIRLDRSADGGVAPGESIVAFSTLCTHKGCPVSFKRSHNMLLCPCHWSSFDPAKGGRMVIGQASEQLPQIALQVNDGMVRAIGVAGLIYGRHTNIR